MKRFRIFYYVDIQPTPDETDEELIERLTEDFKNKTDSIYHNHVEELGVDVKYVQEVP